MEMVCIHENEFPLTLLLCRNMVATAASYYKATLSVTTGLSAPFNNLAIIYKQQVVMPLI